MGADLHLTLGSVSGVKVNRLKGVFFLGEGKGSGLLSWEGKGSEGKGSGLLSWCFCARLLPWHVH